MGRLRMGWLKPRGAGHGSVGLAVLALTLVSAAGAAGTQRDTPQSEGPQSDRQQGEMSGWLQDRARAYEAHLEAGGAERPGTGMWRERPAEVSLPEFVPPTSLAPLIRAVRSGVVNIRTVNSQPGAPPGIVGPAAGRSLGSGFIISPDGHVVTNNHVVERAQQIQVRLADGREFLADVVGRDRSTDVALLRLRGVGKESLPMTYLGDSDLLEVGDWVVAIGNPFGLDHSVAHGMISAKERIIGVGLFDDFIQTDALINPGNSGGPLFNMRGEVVGVTTAVVSQGQGIGFSVPINLVKDLLPNLRENGRLERGWLGVQASQVEAPAVAGEAERHGVELQTVIRESPAEKAGLRPGDRVVAVNGRPIDAYQHLLRRVAILAPGTEVRMTVLRGRETREVSVTLGRRPVDEDLQAVLRAGTVDSLGLILQDLTPEVASALQLPPGSGVLVAAVLPRSPAEAAGLRSGDLLVELNRRRVQDVASARRALERADAGRAVLLRVQRGDVQQYVALEPR
jgi:serine protease Do